MRTIHRTKTAATTATTAAAPPGSGPKRRLLAAVAIVMLACLSAVAAVAEPSKAPKATPAKAQALAAPKAKPDAKAQLAPKPKADPKAAKPESTKPDEPPIRPPTPQGEPRGSSQGRFFRPPAGASKSHIDVRRAFAPLVASARKSTAAVYCGDKQVALAVVVDAEGHLVTKASELTGPAECLFHNGARRKARLIGVSKDDDLALLKVDANALTPIEWAPDDDPAVGSWIVTPGTGAEPVATGVVSV